jgi:GT2 family glycosyltransferase
MPESERFGGDPGLNIQASDQQPEKIIAGSDPRPPTNDSRIEIFGVSGAAAMYRMSFIRDVTVGGEFLDEDFFTFREDADVAWRGQLFGWRALYVPDAVAHHVRSVTPEKRRALSAVTNMHGVKNRFLLRLKNEGIYLALRNAPFELGRDLVAIAATLTIERSSLPAFGWLWKNRRRIMQKRRAIQSRRRVSDRQLAGWFR